MWVLIALFVLTGGTPIAAQPVLFTSQQDCEIALVEVHANPSSYWPPVRQHASMTALCVEMNLPAGESGA